MTKVSNETTLIEYFPFDRGLYNMFFCMTIVCIVSKFHIELEWFGLQINVLILQICLLVLDINFTCHFSVMNNK